MLNELLSFAVVAAVLTIIPGLDTTLVLRSTLATSKRAGFATGIGIVSGLLAWAAFVAVGLDVVIQRWSGALTFLRVAACIYLTYLGMRLLIDAVRKDKSFDLGETKESDIRASFMRGFLTNALNPKIAIFYVTMLPQFYPHDISQLAGGLLLAAIHGVESLLWFSFLIFVAARMRNWFGNQQNLRILDISVSLILFGFALHLALTPLN